MRSFIFIQFGRWWACLYLSGMSPPLNQGGYKFESVGLLYCYNTPTAWSEPCAGIPGISIYLHPPIKSQLSHHTANHPVSRYSSVSLKNATYQDDSGAKNSQSPLLSYTHARSFRTPAPLPPHAFQVATYANPATIAHYSTLRLRASTRLSMGTQAINVAKAQ